MSKIKPCPFCGSEAKLVTDYASLEREALGFAPDYLKVKCTKCSACSGSVRKSCFAVFTAYRVEQFRTDPELRDREELEYAKHVSRLEHEAVDKWNQRKPNELPF